MVALNSSEDHEAGSSQNSECASTSACTSNCCPQQPTHTLCNHLFNKAAEDSIEEENVVPNAGRTSTSVLYHSSSSKIPQPKHNFHPKSGLCLSPSKQTEISKAAASMSGRISLGSAPDTLPSNLPTWLTAEAPVRQQDNHLPEDSLQWLQALELQVVGACRSDERLRPLLRWNVSCFGSDGRLLAHLGQHFKARELALLARCLCTPVVSLRVGKVSRHSRYLCPTSARGYLNLMLLPCSEMQLSFADDVGTVERVAVTIPGVKSGGILIEELKEDTSRRTFVLKDQGGNITNYFWQSEKLKSTGHELIIKMRNMLKRRPTLAHLTGIDEGRLNSFAEYRRTAIFSKASNALSQMAIPTQLVPPIETDEESSKRPSISATLPLRRSLLKFSTFPKISIPTDSQYLSPSQAPHRTRVGEPVNLQPIESSMDKLGRCMQEIDTSAYSDGPESCFASSLSATAKLIESLKRLRNCLHSLSDRRNVKALTLDRSLPSSSQAEDADSKPDSETGAHLMKFITEPLIKIVLSPSPFASDKYLPKISSFPVLPKLLVKTSTLDQPSGHYPCPSGTIWEVNAQQALASTTVVYRDLGPTLDPAWSLQAHPVQFCPSVTKLFDFSRPLVCPSDSGILHDLFTQSVSQIPLMISYLSNETLCTHNLHVLPFVLEHAEASSLPHFSVIPHVHDYLRRANLFHLSACSGYGVPILRKSFPMSSAQNQTMSYQRGGEPYLVQNDLVIHPSARLRVSGSKSRKQEPGMEICQDRTAGISNAQCGACHRCASGTGLGNLVLVNFYAQETGPRLRVITAEITTGNISYIVKFLQSF